MNRYEYDFYHYCTIYPDFGKTLHHVIQWYNVCYNNPKVVDILHNEKNNELIAAINYYNDWGKLRCNEILKENKIEKKYYPPQSQAIFETIVSRQDDAGDDQNALEILERIRGKI